MKKLVYILVPVAFVLNSFGPTTQVSDFRYDVSLDGQPIGTYTVNKTTVGEAETFRVETTTAAGLISRMKHRFVMLSSYNQKNLVSADMKTWVNDRLESSAVIHWDGNQYVMQHGEKLEEICLGMVNYSSACVYFKEPIDRTSLFYEKYGTELTVKTIAEHQYEISLPNGGVERYTYKDGQVSEVQFVQSFATITLRKSS